MPGSQHLSVCLSVSPPHNLASLRRPQECDNLWWDAFTTEFFEDDAMLTITFCLEDGPKRYSEYQLEPSFPRALPLWEAMWWLCCWGEGCWQGVRAQLPPADGDWGAPSFCSPKARLGEPGLLTSSSFSRSSDRPDSDSPLLPQHL